MPVGLLWDATAGEAIAAELLRRFPHKRPSIHPNQGAAAWFKRDVEAAWRCYQDGAAGALFDVLRALDVLAIPVPEAVALARDDLLRAALLGDGVSRGRGAAAPLLAHDKALAKRLRWRVVQWVLDEAAAYAWQDDPRHGAVAKGADAELYLADRATWPEVSTKHTRAAELAREKLGDEMVGWRAIYDAWREVDDFRRAGTWPGPFYLPSAATCEALRLEAGLRLIREGWEAADAPRWGVA
jgi:hypothetical protein